MKKLTAGTLFSGGGGVDIGLMQAGVEILWGNEYIEEIANHNESQLKHKIYKCSILDLDPTTLPKVDILHASPPCPSFSIANQNKGETENDLALAHKVAEFIAVLRPKVFTLENVWGYRKSESWKVIAEKLNEVYGPLSWEIEHINFADAGVPQARKRMMVRAVSGLVFGIAQIPKPIPVPHVGWFAAVEDIIDTFPESKFADWQLKRLKELPEYTFLMEGTTGGDRPPTTRSIGEPSDVIMTGKGGRVQRAFLVTGENSKANGKRHKHNGETRFTVSTSNNDKALLVDGTLGSYGTNITTKTDKKPAYTQTASQEKRPAKALRGGGKVVAITRRGVARFCSFPDWYELPAKKVLAMTILGNSAPPLGYQWYIQPILEFIKVNND